MCLNFCLWHMASETWLQRKKMREEITKEIQGPGTAVLSFIVFNMQIILKPEQDHLPLIPHYWEWKCEQAQSRIRCCLENRRLFYSVSSMAIISFQEFSQKCSCTWHINKWSGTKQGVKMAGKHLIKGWCCIWRRAGETCGVVKSAFAIFPVWERVFSERRGVLQRTASTKG